MRKHSIIIVSIVFILLVNTSYFWDALPDLWDKAIVLLLCLVYIALIGILIIQIYQLIKAKFSDRKRIIVSGSLLAAILLATLYPRGIYDFEKLEGPDLLVARYDGVANGASYLKLKSHNRFVLKSIFWSVDRYYGSYQIMGDTIRFNFDEGSAYTPKSILGIFRRNTLQSSLRPTVIAYYKPNISRPLPFIIVKNELK